MTFKHAFYAALGLASLAACASQPEVRLANAHVIKVGTHAHATDLDTCINDGFTGMAGQWTMRFANSTPDGRLLHNLGTLIIKPKATGRWTIQRPGPDGAMRDYSVITNYGDGQLESVALGEGAQTIFEERYVVCHDADASGRAKFVSTLDQRLRRGGPMMRTTRTGWLSQNNLYSIDVSEALDGSGEYALSTRFGTRQE